MNKHVVNEWMNERVRDRVKLGSCFMTVCVLSVSFSFSCIYVMHLHSYLDHCHPVSILVRLSLFLSLSFYVFIFSFYPFWAAAPKGTMSQGTFVRLSVRLFVPLASRLKSQPPGSNQSLQAQITASRLKSQP